MNSQELATQASYQIEAVATALKAAAKSDDVESLPWLALSLAIRIIELNGVLMSHVRGDDDTVGYFRKVVQGDTMGETA